VFGSGKVLSLSYYSSNFLPKRIIIVASPPSSTIRSGPFPSGKVSAAKVHSQYSSKLSFFQANTAAVPAFAIADAA